MLGTIGDRNMPEIVWGIHGSKIFLYIHVTQITSGYLHITYGIYLYTFNNEGTMLMKK